MIEPTVHSLVAQIYDAAAELYVRVIGSWLGQGIISNAAYTFIFVVVVRWVCVRSARVVRAARTRKRIEALNERIDEKSGLVVLTGSRLELLEEHVKFRHSERRYCIRFPNTSRAAMSAANPSFVFNDEDEPDIVRGLKERARLAIPDLEDVLQSASEITAADFIRRSYRERLFNGDLFHVYKTNMHAKISVSEEALIDIDLYLTDYFTSQTILCAYRMMRSRKCVAELLQKREVFDELAFFWNGFGINTIVCATGQARSVSSGTLVLGKRSERVSRNVATGRWHSTMNEALSQSDVEDQAVSLRKCFSRGLREEAGLSENEIIKTYLFSVVIGLEDMQPGILGLTFSKIDVRDANPKRHGSQDGSSEIAEVAFCAFADRDISHVLSKNGLVGADRKFAKLSLAAEAILSNIIARGTSSFSDF